MKNNILFFISFALATVAQLQPLAPTTDTVKLPQLECPSEDYTQMTDSSAEGEVVSCMLGAQFDGPSYSVYPDGTLKSKGVWDDDVKEGSWYEFNNSKNTKTHMTYENGVLHGAWTEESAGGTLISRGDYACGEKQGRWLQTSENGKINSVNFPHDTCRGEVQFWRFGKMAANYVFQKDGYSLSPYLAWSPRLLNLNTKWKIKGELGYSLLKGASGANINVVDATLLFYYKAKILVDDAQIIFGLIGTLWHGYGIAPGLQLAYSVPLHIDLYFLETTHLYLGYSTLFTPQLSHNIRLGTEFSF